MSIPNFNNLNHFKEYLQNRLIPDLKESGMHATAEDFEEAIYWIEDLQNDNLN